MCGIAVIVKNSKQDSEEVLKDMLREIKHRGPDHTGIFRVDKNSSMGMNRLSIIDLKGGNQPILSQDKKTSIVFNGEIYNYKKLKENLEKEGYQFKTNSDTEVILNLYIKHRENPEEFLLKLRGMFAFAIYDQDKEEFFVARDFFGIKPAYYIKNEKNEILALSSEIKALLLHPDYKKRINYSAVRNYLSFQYNPLKESFFSGIFRVDPGSVLYINKNSGKFREKKFFDFNLRPRDINEQKAIKEVFEVINDSVAHHLVSDVPVGTFLSGGVDSFIITALAQKLNPDQKIHTFTIGGEKINEFDRARAAAKFLKTEHTEINLDRKKYFSSLPKIIRYFDEPVADPSAYALYFLSQEAAKKVKVVLSGEGADEFFGGYMIYREPMAISIITRLPSFIKKIIFLLLKLPFSFFGKNYLKRASLPLEERYIGNANIFSEIEVKKIWNKEYLPKRFSLKFLYKKARNFSDSEKMQYIDIHTWLVGDILSKADKMSMANSLEVRTPFLDLKVADFAKKIPDNLKYRNGKTKFLLHNLAKNLLREDVPERKRIGFAIPLSDWLKKENEWKKTILESSFLGEIFDINFIKNLINEDISKREKSARKIFVLLILAIWHKEFFEK